MYKKILLPIIFLFSFYTAHSQVHVTPLVGYGFFEMKDFNNDYFYLVGSFKNDVDNSFIYGIKISQRINEKLLFDFVSTYSRKKFFTVSHDSRDHYLRFSNWNFIPRLNYNILDKLWIGVGFNYGFKWHKSQGEFKNGVYDHQYGVNLNINYNIKNIDINLNFNKGIGYFSDNSFFLKPHNGINLMVGYRFKVLNTWKRTKDVNCPTL